MTPPTIFGAEMRPDKNGVFRVRLGLLDFQVEQKEHVCESGVTVYFQARADANFVHFITVPCATSAVAILNLEQVLVGGFAELDRSLPRARA